MYVCMYACMHACVYMIVYVCICMYLYVSVWVCIYLYVSVCICMYLHVSVCICMYLSVSVSLSVPVPCLSVCLSVCMYVCMHVCVRIPAFTAPASGITTKMDVAAQSAVKGLSALNTTHRHLGQHTWIGGCHSVTHYDSLGTLGSIACSPGLNEIPPHPLRGESFFQGWESFSLSTSSVSSNQDKDT
jgi:hypothetical protein